MVRVSPVSLGLQSGLGSIVRVLRTRKCKRGSDGTEKPADGGVEQCESDSSSSDDEEDLCVQPGSSPASESQLPETGSRSSVSLTTMQKKQLLSGDLRFLGRMLEDSLQAQKFQNSVKQSCAAIVCLPSPASCVSVIVRAGVPVAVSFCVFGMSRRMRVTCQRYRTSTSR